MKPGDAGRVKTANEVFLEEGEYSSSLFYPFISTKGESG